MLPMGLGLTILAGVRGSTATAACWTLPLVGFTLFALAFQHSRGETLHTPLAAR